MSFTGCLCSCCQQLSGSVEGEDVLWDDREVECTESLPHYIINSGKKHYKSRELAPVENHVWRAPSFLYFIIAGLLYSTFGVCSGNAHFCTWMVGSWVLSLWLQNNQFKKVQRNMLYTRHLRFATPWDCQSSLFLKHLSTCMTGFLSFWLHVMVI